MKINLYIEHADLGDFYSWVNRLGQGSIEPSPIKFSHRINEFTDPLCIQLTANEYAVILDAQEEAQEIIKLAGPIDVKYSTADTHWQSSIIRNVIKNAERNNVLNEVVFFALNTMSELPSLTPAEAMVIAEGTYIQ